jgi:thiol-disulfide isomerase/thioredoxin
VRRWALLAVAALGVGCARGATTVDGGAPGPASGAFDYDWSVQRIGGGRVDLDALRGRPLVVNFWASWCPPCVRELGSFEELMRRVRAEGIDATFLFVSPESLDVAAGFVERNGWELPFAVEVRRAPATLGALVLPTTLIVDRRGTIALRHRGATDWNQPEIVELLASLAAQEPPRPATGSGAGSDPAGGAPP